MRGRIRRLHEKIIGNEGEINDAGGKGKMGLVIAIRYQFRAPT